jgi:16S rRNA (cytidine1402-2'-O)-methyltransferase
VTDDRRTTTTGRLYIVATPIGNLEDISFRAVRILKEVDLIAAEDTRHTRKLLTHLGINTPLISYYREKEKEKGGMILARLEDGEDIALVSDAGTPGISDPGTMLVAQARERGFTVIPIPGPAAITAAVSASGFGEQGFLFCGFLPAKQGQRRKKLEPLKNCEVPLVFYESPHRIIPMLKDTMTVLGDRPSCIARELTKTYEEFRFGPLSELCRHYEQDKIRGEFVVIVAPGKKQTADEQTVTEAILWYRDHGGLSMKDATRQIAADFGLSRSVVYREALQLWKS